MNNITNEELYRAVVKAQELQKMIGDLSNQIKDHQLAETSQELDRLSVLLQSKMS